MNRKKIDWLCLMTWAMVVVVGLSFWALIAAFVAEFMHPVAR